jgi:hypothetical protein
LIITGNTNLRENYRNVVGLLKKSKSINRKVRKGITQRSQSIKYQSFSLRPLRKALASLAVKKDFFNSPTF